MHINKTLTVTLADETEIEVDVEFRVTPGSDGYLAGAPEDCYEAEGAEWEIVDWEIATTDDVEESQSEIDAINAALKARCALPRRASVPVAIINVLEPIEEQIGDQANEYMDEWVDDEGGRDY